MRRTVHAHMHACARTRCMLMSQSQRVSVCVSVVSLRCGTIISSYNSNLVCILQEKSMTKLQMHCTILASTSPGLR